MNTDTIYFMKKKGITKKKNDKKGSYPRNQQIQKCKLAIVKQWRSLQIIKFAK